MTPPPPPPPPTHTVGVAPDLDCENLSRVHPLQIILTLDYTRRLHHVLDLNECTTALILRIHNHLRLIPLALAALCWMFFTQ